MKRPLATFIIVLVLFFSLNHFALASELLLKDIRFEKAAQGQEMVFFELSDFYTPEISTLEEERPRVVCDFFDIKIKDSIKKEIVTNGEFIQRIHVEVHSSESKIRIVLDLVPQHKYYVRQKFFMEEKIFALIVGIQ